MNLNNFYHKNEFKNIRLKQVFSYFSDSEKNVFYKLFINIKEFKNLKFSNFKYLFLYLNADIKHYKQEYSKILYNDFRSGVRLIDFCDYYQIDISKIKKILEKKFFNINDYYNLLNFAHSLEVEKYFDIISDYKKEKDKINIDNIFLLQNGKKTKKIIFKEKYKGKNIILSTDKDLENFEIIRKKVKLLSI